MEKMAMTLAHLVGKYPDRLHLSIEELAAEVGITPKAMINRIYEGTCPIPTRRLGHHRVAHIHDLARWLSEGGEMPARPRAQRQRRGRVKQH